MNGASASFPMHRALHVEEILLNIFDYLRPSATGFLVSARQRRQNAHLAVMARTCTAFKEPALDIIWAEIDDLTPLVRCLSEEFWTVNEPEYGGGPLYSLKRTLGQAEWDIILGYARRVQFLYLRCSFGLAGDSIESLSKAPVTGSIFPKLRVITLCGPSEKVAPLVRYFAHPKVTKISLWGGEIFDTAIDAFGSECPFVTHFDVSEWTNKDALSDLVCHWENLRSLSCGNLSLDIRALSHLSRLCNLVCMSFGTNDAVVDQIHIVHSLTASLTFPALDDLDLTSTNLTPISRLIRHFRLPVISDLSVHIYVRPTVSDLMSFFALLREVSPNNSLRWLSLYVYSRDGSMSLVSPFFRVTFDCLNPLTVFANINSITLRVPCTMDLNEREFLALASSWPHLETFEVVGNYDWTPSSALTLAGFLQLLEICRSLRVLCFVFDVRGYSEIPQGHPWRGLRMPEHTYIHLLNTPIEEESIEALGVFFHVAPYPNFSLKTHWNNFFYQGSERPRELCDLYYNRWVRARELARDLWEERRNLRHSLEAPTSHCDPE